MATTRIEMDNEELLTLAASIAICCLAGLERHMPNHSALGRKVRAVEEAIASLASLNAAKLPEDMLVLGTRAWGHTMKYVANNIKEKAAQNAD